MPETVQFNKEIDGACFIGAEIPDFLSDTDRIVSAGLVDLQNRICH